MVQRAGPDGGSEQRNRVEIAELIGFVDSETMMPVVRTAAFDTRRQRGRRR